jgi:beta-fructofuranosidase
MQYFKPVAPNAFAGDAMPFSHNGVFHLFYLLDHDHHQSLDGLGGHQWAHASSRDLIRWEHYPLAIGITEPWEGSICTGSAFATQDAVYGFYATRHRDHKQYLDLAMSHDGIHFVKRTPTPLASPEAHTSPYHYRDPFVFRDPATGRFHMLVTAMLASPELEGYGGYLAHLSSSDLQEWEEGEPCLVSPYPGAPECPDLFEWNGWTYLLFSHDLITRYRMIPTPPAGTPVLPAGWLRPSNDILDSPRAAVMKTAPFGANRRIGVAWIGTREQGCDGGKLQWGGNLLFRELVQHADGTLGTRFPPEMGPSSGKPRAHAVGALTQGVLPGDDASFTLVAPRGLAANALLDVPRNARIKMRVIPAPGTAEFGLRLRGTGRFAGGYMLRFRPSVGTVSLHDVTLHSVDGLDQAFDLDIIMHDDIIDVSVDARCCLVNRLPEQRGDRLFCFCQEGQARFDAVEIRPLLSP